MKYITVYLNFWAVTVYMYVMFSTVADGQSFSVSSYQDNLSTISSPLSIITSGCKLDMINEGYTSPDENITESSLTEAVADIKYHIRLLEEIELLIDGNKTMVRDLSQ